MKTKLLMYRTLVRPLLTYAPETWYYPRQMKDHSVCLKEEFSRCIFKQCRIRVHVGRGITMNSVSYVMSQILLNI
jgi:hypothetical protein